MRTLTIALLLAPLIAPAVARAQCVVASSGGSLPRVRIEPAGVPAFELEIEEPNDVEVIGGSGERARVRGIRPLAFEGTTGVAGLALRPTRRVVAASGVLTLDAEADLVASALAAREATVDVALVGGVALGVRVPCRSLRVTPTSAAEAPARGALPAGAPSVIASGGTLEVRARSRGPVVLTIRVDDAELMRMAELRRDGDAVEILLTGRGATAVRGWVDASEIQTAPDGAFGETGRGGVGHGCGYGSSGDHYRGPATLRAQVAIRAAPDGPIWARSTRAIEVTIAIERAGGPVRIERIDGIRALAAPCRLETAWVRAEDVELPGGARP